MISFLTSGFFASMLSFLAIYVALTVILHLQANVAGVVNFGIAGFWGIGMYATSIFLLRFNINFWISIVLGAIVTGLIALPLARILLNLDGQAVLVGTLAFASIVENQIFVNREITGGSRGLGTIPMPIDVGPYRFIVYGLVVVAFVVALILYAWKLKKAPFGRLLFSIRDNELLSRSLGKPTFRHKIIFFAITCGLIGLFGGLTAPLHSFLLPMMVSPTVTFTAWIALMLGGQSKISGAVIGVLATEFVFFYLLRVILPLPAEAAQMVPFFIYAAYGLMLVLVLMFKPTGIMGGKRRGN
ncbi:MAG: branched-chain amino acid ABC transporter permease [Oscillospiraceae bacterium]|nr:branched-chain amino acid ABC transporter permease [Oscillospiraceae bacterium]